jgi:hypothetical protein
MVFDGGLFVPLTLRVSGRGPRITVGAILMPEAAAVTRSGTVPAAECSSVAAAKLVDR